jgi:hypothetical protein
MVLHPRHRGNCADFFVAPQQTERVELAGPRSAIGEIEHAAARAERTWNDQFLYVLELCLGYHLPDFDDERSVEDWRLLLSRCRFRCSEADNWSPCTCLWRKTP